MRIVTSFIGLWFVFGGLVFFSPNLPLEPLAAFFAGYNFHSLIILSSIDSMRSEPHRRSRRSGRS